MKQHRDKSLNLSIGRSAIHRGLDGTDHKMVNGVVDVDGMDTDTEQKRCRPGRKGSERSGFELLMATFSLDTLVL